MSESLSIKRKKSAADEFSFEQLKRDGISYAQQFSGKLWSDFNHHDPGVTILEQLCYALTDLIHRATFDVADYLVNNEGQLDFDRLALYRPEQILPARPTTLLDYRRAILEAVVELENIWLTPLASVVKNGQSLGLYHVALKLNQGVTQEQRGAVIRKIRHFYNANRNLCEDIATITIVKNDNYQLHAEIEVESGRRPAEIMADIYSECSRLVSGCRSHGQERNAVVEDDLDQIANDPSTDQLHSTFQKEVLLSSLFSLINGVSGVDQIKTLYFEKEGLRYYDAIVCSDPGMALNLLIPETAEEIGVRLWTSARVLPVAITELRARYDERSFALHSSRRVAEDSRAMPTGIVRSLTDYFSIQNQFPVVYGIGDHGIPNSAAEGTKARAKQLKSYLLIFEQLMANYLANLEFIKSLFSTVDCNETYATLALNKTVIPGFEALFSGDGGHEISAIVARFDNVADRKNRLLDYLLGLYGESFPQHSLRHFNYYHNQYEADEVTIANKISYLKAVVELGRDRAAAANYSAALGSPQHRSGLVRRVSLLLGFKERDDHALTLPFLRQGLVLEEHHRYQQNKEPVLVELETLDSDVLASFETVAARYGDDGIGTQIGRGLVGDKVPLENTPLSDRLLREGINIDRYRIGTFTNGINYQLLFLLEGGLCWNLGSFSDRPLAVVAAHSLRKFLIQLNEESEGFHLVEHVLLRPDSRENVSHVARSIPPTFYSFRISVIFPAWSARCHDPQFRMLAEETVMLNTPAHIHPEFYWLDFQTMYEFEMVYEKWLALKRETVAPVEEINSAALKVINFLMKQGAAVATGNGHG